MSRTLPANKFHVLVRIVSTAEIKEEHGGSRTVATVCPAALTLYYRGSIDNDGTEAALHTPVGMLTTDATAAHHGIGSALRLGGGVVAVPRAVIVRTGSSATAPVVKSVVLRNNTGSPLVGMHEELVKEGAEIEVSISLFVEAPQYAPLNGDGGGSHGLGLLAAGPVPVIPDQIFAVGDQRYVLIGSCGRGRCFNPASCVLFPSTFAAIYLDNRRIREGIRRQRDDAECAPDDERTAKAPFRPVVCKEEEEEHVLW